MPTARPALKRLLKAVAEQWKIVLCNMALGWCAVVPMLGIRAVLAGTISPAQISYLSSLRTIPWFLKPLIAFFCDSLAGEKKTFVFGSVVIACSWYALPDISAVAILDDISPIALASFCASAGLAFADVALDSAAIKSHSGTRSNASKKMSDIWILRTTAAALATVAAGILTVRSAAALTCVVALAMPVCSISRVESSKDKTQVPVKKLAVFGLLAFCMSAGPSADPMMTVVLGQQYGFHRKAFAALGLLECLTMAMGSLAYKLYVRHAPPRKVIAISTAVMMCSPILFMAVFITRTFVQSFAAVASSSILYLMSSSFLSSVLLCEASRGLPKGSEASFFSAIAACFNLGGIVSTLSGGALAQRFSPRVILVVESFGNLLYLLALFLVRKEDPDAPCPEQER